jgi:DNA-binding GntR family transcriptional regulator
MKQNDIDEPITIGERAYSILFEAIADDTLPRNQFLSQRKLAELTGTSIISVREALKRLEHEGIIEAIPKWGVRIPLATKERLIEIYQVREALEVMSAYLLSRHSTGEQRERLNFLAKRCDELQVTDEQSIRCFSEYHREFHLFLAEATGNTQLKENLNRIGLRMILYHSARCTWFRQFENWAYWHRSLLEEIFSGDPVRAQLQMHVHIQQGLHYDLLTFDGNSHR